MVKVAQLSCIARTRHQELPRVEMSSFYTCHIELLYAHSENWGLLYTYTDLANFLPESSFCCLGDASGAPPTMTSTSWSLDSSSSLIPFCSWYPFWCWGEWRWWWWWWRWRWWRCESFWCTSCWCCCKRWLSSVVSGLCSDWPLLWLQSTVVVL